MPNSFSRAGPFIRSPRFPIFMIVFVDVLGLGITIPVLPLFAKNQLGAEAWHITALTSVFFAAQFFAGPVLGRLSDRYGRRPVLILSQGGTLSALLLTAFAPSVLILYVARVIDGLTGGNISVAQAYLSDITDEKNRARGLGVINASFGLGFVFGPAFGSLLASFFGPRVPFLVAAVVSLCTILLSAFFLPESLPAERRRADRIAAAASPRARGWKLLRVPSVALLLIVGFFVNFAFFNFQTIFVLWAEKLVFPSFDEASVQRAVGLILTFVGISGVIAQFWLVGPLVKRFGEKKLVVGGNAARFFAFGLVALSPTVAAVFLSIPFMSIGGSVALPVLIALLTFFAPPDSRGQAIGLNQSFAAAGAIVGPLTAGFLFQNVHPNAPMIAAVALMGIATLISLNVFRFKPAVAASAPAK
ncbi:MAG: MFS transporter [Chloroflexi bacterium]|nr:MFS transporter [Chloroflexota bacterium]